MRTALLLAMALTCLFTSCASIVGDTDQNVLLQSSPDGATVKVTRDNGQVIFEGVTPSQVTLEMGDGYFSGIDYTVEFSKEGFTSSLMRLETNANNWYLFGNIVFGGLIGWLIVDPLTGAMWKIEPETAFANLAPVSSE